MTSRRRRLLAALLLLLVLGGIAVVLVLVESRGVPAWYAPPTVADEQASRLAERVEQRLAEEVTAVRDPEAPWTLRVEDAQINTWLALRLPEWLAGRGVDWPPTLGVPQVRARDGGLDLALPVGAEGASRVIVVELEPRTDERGLWLDVQRVRIGRIPIPGEPATALASLVGDAASGPEGRDVLEVLTGRRPMRLRFRLADERRIEVRDVECRPGEVYVTSLTMGPQE